MAVIIYIYIYIYMSTKRMIFFIFARLLRRLKKTRPVQIDN
jgi:hypothetical protein